MSVSAFPYGVAPSTPSGPVVDANNTSIFNTNPGSDCYAGVEYNSSGVEYGSTNTGSFTNNRGNWLTSGDASEVWVERTINSGSLSSWLDEGAGRHQLNTTRQFGVVDTTIPGGAISCNVTFEFYDASSGGNLLDSVTITLSGDKSV